MIEKYLPRAETPGKNSKIISEISALRSKKAIVERGLFLIEGKKAVQETLGDAAFLPEVKSVVLSVTVGDDYLKKISFINSNKCVKIYSVPEDLFRRISGDETPEGALCVASIPKRDPAPMFSDEIQRLFVVLDAINDPGNLGTILRLADNFAVSAVLLGPNSAFEYSHKVIKASMGSFRNTPAARIEGALGAELLEAVGRKDSAVFYPDISGGTDLRAAAEAARGGKFRKIFVVGGSESHGVRGERITGLIGAAANAFKARIPCYGGNESLNLSVAMGIFCYEMAGAIFERGAGPRGGRAAGRRD